MPRSIANAAAQIQKGYIYHEMGDHLSAVEAFDAGIKLAPEAAHNHPTEEHLLPLFVALGAGEGGAPARHLHASATYGILRMDVFAFG